MNIFSKVSMLAVAIAIAGAVAAPVQAQELKAKTAVLVHGAFADGSSWNKVIPLLKQAGLKVVAVQNPLDSLENDVAFTNRAIEAAEGPIVLVGHSWGGVVITEAGVNEKVRSLVYVAAYAPDVGQSLVDTGKGYPDAAGRSSIQEETPGSDYLKITDEGIFNYFAADLTRSEQELVAATQGSFSKKAISTPVTTAAWKTVPSFSVVATDDAIIPPALQHDQVRKMKATATDVASSHVPMLSHPDVVAKVIIDAAK